MFKLSLKPPANEPRPQSLRLSLSTEEPERKRAGSREEMSSPLKNTLVSDQFQHRVRLFLQRRFLS